jgi:hypothetical protein
MIKKIICKGVAQCNQFKVGTYEYIVGTCKEVAEVYHSVKEDFRYAGEEIVAVEFPDSLRQELEDKFQESPRKIHIT